jgi:GntR family transcriptional repressor for pyruvate dehydrogenase complex
MFVSVRSEKMSERIIDQIRSVILEKKLNPGDRLLPEKELLEKFGVSKFTLREALRSLESLGLIEIRKGAAGGAYIKSVDVHTARNCLNNFLHFRNISLNHLSEIRLLLESHAAESAVGRISEDDLANIKTIIEKSEQDLVEGITHGLREAEMKFHGIIATAGGNPILIFLLECVEHILLDVKEALQPGADFCERVIAAHKLIYDALLCKDAFEVKRQMERHVMEVHEDLVKLQKMRGMGEVVDLSNTCSRRKEGESLKDG